MLNTVRLTDLIYIDIETAPVCKTFEDLTALEKILWNEKKGRLKPENESEEEYYFQHAGIFAEFGKIICISVGWFMEDKDFSGLKIKSFYGHNEMQILKDFAFYLQNAVASNKNKQLCGHNIKEFDIPFICRRMLMNEMSLPEYFEQLQAKKPWEAGLLDTMDLWKFGDYKNYISLKLLAYSLGIPSPKDDISGSDVGKVYWSEQDIERIKTYCQKDVLTVAQIILKLKGKKLISENEVLFV